MTKPHEPTEAQKAEVRALASMGIPHDQISAYIGIDKKTLYKYYREILGRAKIQANMKMAQCLFQQAQNGSTPAAIFWLKVQAGWQDRQAVDVTTNGESVNYKPTIIELVAPNVESTDTDTAKTNTIIQQA